MIFDLQSFTNIFTILAVLIALIAFLDSRVRRTLLTMKTKTANVWRRRDAGGAQFTEDGPALEIIFVNRGFFPVYPLRLYLRVNLRHKIEMYGVSMPENGLLPGRSLRHQVSQNFVYRNLPADALKWRWVFIRPVILLENGVVRTCRFLPVKVSDLAATPKDEE